MLNVAVVVGVFSLALFQTIGEVSGTEATQKVSRKEKSRGAIKVDAVVLGKVCNGKIAGDKIAIAPSSPTTTSSSKILSLPEPFTKKGKDAQCITAKGQEPDVFVREKGSILDRLNRKSIALGARSESALKELDYFDDVLVNSLVENYSIMEKSKRKDKNFLFNIIDPKEISFMFQMSSAAYYKTDFEGNINNISTAYKQRMNEIDKGIKILKGTLEDIADLRKIIKDARQNTVVRLAGKKTEAETKGAREQAESSRTKGSQGEGISLKQGIDQGKSEFEHMHQSNLAAEGQSVGQGKTESSEMRVEGENIKIISLASDVVKSIREEYRLLFRGELPETAHLADIRDKLDDLELKTENDLLEQERVQSMLSDPRVGAYWAKLELTYAQRATGLEPIYILYRNFDSYKKPILGLGSGFIKSKDQPLSIIDKKKELSGVVMYKEKDKNSSVDEVIIAFSGSKSSEDWKHNFDIFRQQGEISTQLGAGLKMHKGIFQSLQSSLEDAGTNLNFWLTQYLKKYELLKKDNPEIEKPTLNFTITGHSLGGGLALLMATWINDNVKKKLFKNKVNVKIKVYTFGAPPIFRKRSAATVEKELGKENVIRVWNIGDPVANLSLLRKEFNDKDRSVVMSLTGYDHVGISVPIYDPEHLVRFFDKLSPWSNHLSDRYFNLIETNNLKLVYNKINVMEKKLKDNQFFSNKIYGNMLDQMITFIRNPGDKPVETFPLKQIPFEDFKTDILTEKDTSNEENNNKALDLSMKNYEQIKKARVEKGLIASPELKRSTIEKNEIKYTHQLMSMPVPMVVDRSTSCEFGAIKKQVNSQLKKEKDKQIGVLRSDEQSELSCVCCLSKNFILTNKTVIEKTKKLLKGKKISTVSETIRYCDKYCQPLKDSKILESGSGDVNSVRDLLQRRTGKDINEAFGAIELKPAK